jgi:2-aminoadipate transaminase
MEGGPAVIQAGVGLIYDGPVVYMGTLSKEIVPGLRIGWVIAAPRMIEAQTMAKQGSDMCTSGLTQWVAMAALESGVMERAQPAILNLYRSRRDALCASMTEHLSDWFDWKVPVGSMFVWAVTWDPLLATDRLLPEALKAGVCVAPSSVFDPTGQDRCAIRINFTLNLPDHLVEGVYRLASALRALSSQKD